MGNIWQLKSNMVLAVDHCSLLFVYGAWKAAELWQVLGLERGWRCHPVPGAPPHARATPSTPRR